MRRVVVVAMMMFSMFLVVAILLTLNFRATWAAEAAKENRNTLLAGASTAGVKPPYFRLAVAEPLRHHRLDEVAADIARYRSKGYNALFFENDYLRWSFRPEADAGFGGNRRMFNEIRGLKIAALDNAAFLCDEHCPHAHGTSQAEHAANLLDETAFLREVAARLYRRPEAREPAVRGWQAFGRGFGNLPIGLGDTGCDQFSGRFGMAWSMCIATPLVRQAIADTDQRHKIHWFSPYNFFRPNLSDRLEACFLRVLANWQVAAQELAVADALEGRTTASRREALSAEGHVVCVFSALNWCEAARVARTSDGAGRFAQSQRLESDLVRRFQALLRQWPGLWDNNCWHPHHTPLSQRGLGLSLTQHQDAFAAKLAIQGVLVGTSEGF
jgi:hypothetical protein